MSLKDALESAKGSTVPTFERWQATLPPDDLEALLAAAVDPTISHRTFHRIVKAEGVAVAGETLSQWRRTRGFPG